MALKTKSKRNGRASFETSIPFAQGVERARTEFYIELGKAARAARGRTVFAIGDEEITYRADGEVVYRRQADETPAGDKPLLTLVRRWIDMDGL